jgi:hypothetical protein
VPFGVDHQSESTLGGPVETRDHGLSARTEIGGEDPTHEREARPGEPFVQPVHDRTGATGNRARPGLAQCRDAAIDFLHLQPGSGGICIRGDDPDHSRRYRLTGRVRDLERDGLTGSNRRADSRCAHVVDALVASPDGRHDVVPFAFDIGSVGMQSRIQTGLAKNLLTDDDIFRDGHADTNRHDTNIGDRFHMDRYLHRSII